MGLIGRLFAATSRKLHGKKGFEAQPVLQVEEAWSTYEALLLKQKQNQQLEQEITTRYFQAIGRQPPLALELQQTLLVIMEEGAEIAREVGALVLKRDAELSQERPEDLTKSSLHSLPESPKISSQPYPDVHPALALASTDAETSRLLEADAESLPDLEETS